MYFLRQERAETPAAKDHFDTFRKSGGVSQIFVSSFLTRNGKHPQTLEGEDSEGRKWRTACPAGCGGRFCSFTCAEVHFCGESHTFPSGDKKEYGARGVVEPGGVVKIKVDSEKFKDEFDIGPVAIGKAFPSIMELDLHGLPKVQG